VAAGSGELRGRLDVVRRPAQAAAEFAGTLFGLAHRASRLVLPYPEARLAALVVGLGFLNIVSALFHWHVLRLDVIETGRSSSSTASP
jgi:hypothetical protein